MKDEIAIEEARAGALKHHFKNADTREISKMSDMTLASWQSLYPASSPQYLLAENEWKRRLSAEQIIGSRIVAYIGIISALVSVLATWLVSKWS